MNKRLYSPFIPKMFQATSFGLSLFLDVGHFYKNDQQSVFASVSEAIQFRVSTENRSGLLHFVRKDDNFERAFKNGQSPVFADTASKKVHNRADYSSLFSKPYPQKSSRPKSYSLKHFGYISFLMLCFFLMHTSTYGASKQVNPTQQKLSSVEKHITRLQKKLHEAEDKRTFLNQEIAKTDKNINHIAKSLHQTEQRLKTNQSKLKHLKKEVLTLEKRLSEQQTHLAKHLKTRHQLGEYQPLKWLLNQENPNKISRLLTYYQYILHTQQTMIDEVKSLHKALKQKQNAYQVRLAAQQSLKKQLSAREKKFKQAKHYNLALIEVLDKTINDHQKDLQQSQQDKQQLQQLLKSLQKPERTQFSSFSKMRHRLNKPLSIKAGKIEKLNQGLLLSAPEGEAVEAVYPGKVVFSDWLKGYGLLLILDHDQGYMTLYAHNQSLYKDVGDTVKLREQIASVGHSGGLRKNGLYFEVRHRGKALAPLDWLS